MPEFKVILKILSLNILFALLWLQTSPCAPWTVCSSPKFTRRSRDVSSRSWRSWWGDTRRRRPSCWESSTTSSRKQPDSAARGTSETHRKHLTSLCDFNPGGDLNFSLCHGVFLYSSGVRAARETSVCSSWETSSSSSFWLWGRSSTTVRSTCRENTSKR